MPPSPEKPDEPLFTPRNRKLDPNAIPQALDVTIAWCEAQPDEGEARKMLRAIERYRRFGIGISRDGAE